jgi:hypothetical protein
MTLPLWKKATESNHRYAMQPIVLRIINADGVGDYNGLTPTTQLKENLGT